MNKRPLQFAGLFGCLLMLSGATWANEALCINEVLASQVTTTNALPPELAAGGLAVDFEESDSSGDAESDWVEIYNKSNEPIDISGWLLTEKPSRATRKWRPILGAAVVPAKGYLVVWCGKRNRVYGDKIARADVSFSTSGDAIALAHPDGTVVDQFSFGPQFDNISYGRDAANEFAYFREPTPGAANASVGYRRPTPLVTFSEGHGYKTQPFKLVLECPREPQAEIRYTLDGSSPTIDSPRYTEPIAISRTTCVRAAVIDPKSVLQLDNAASYFFVSDIVSADATRPVGFAERVRPGASPIPYGFASEYRAGESASKLAQALTNSVPSVSFVFDTRDLFGEEKGICTHPYEFGEAWERPVMVEWIDPIKGAAAEFTLLAGVRLRGGIVRGHSPKQAFRLRFRTDYGLKELSFPFFGEEGVHDFKSLDLTTAQKVGWARGGRLDTFVQDAFMRDSQGALGEPHIRSRYCHLYLNGNYWGVYQLEERANEQFASDYLGDKPSAYDVVREGQNLEAGSTNAWVRMWQLAQAGFGPDKPENYMILRGLNASGTSSYGRETYLDVANLTVYELVAQFIGLMGCPANERELSSLIAIRNRNDRTARHKGFVFLLRDGEESLMDEDADISSLGTTAWVFPDTIPEGFTRADFGSLAGFNPHQLHACLLADARYRRVFADLLYAACVREDGALTGPNAEARFVARQNELSDAIFAECARWGGTGADAMTFSAWLSACDKMRTFLKVRPAKYIAQCRAKGLYPSVEAPRAVDSEGRLISSALRYTGRVTLTTTASDVKIYYTLGSGDPCTDDGEVSPLAQVYTGPFDIFGRNRLKARARSASGEWSPLEAVNVK